MSRDRQRLIDYLQHIVEAAGRIDKYIDDMVEWSFIENELVQDAVIRNLEVIGEASNNIRKHYPDFLDEHPYLPLGVVYEMRNALSHGYFKVDLTVVWNTVENHLPLFSAQIEEIYEELKDAVEYQTPKQ